MLMKQVSRDTCGHKTGCLFCLGVSPGKIPQLSFCCPSGCNSLPLFPEVGWKVVKVPDKESVYHLANRTAIQYVRKQCSRPYLECVNQVLAESLTHQQLGITCISSSQAKCTWLEPCVSCTIRCCLLHSTL